MYKVYVSASMQDKNFGVCGYGTEEENMFKLRDKIIDLLLANGNFTVFKNQKEWNLTKLAKHCNKCGCDLFVDNHSNAGNPQAQGTEVYYYGQSGKGSKSYKMAELLYNEISPISCGKDRGIKPDTSLYNNGLYVIQKTNPPACLIEHFFHTNEDEVKQFKKNIDKYAYSEYVAICKYFNVDYKKEVKESYDSILKERNKLRGLINDLKEVLK